VDPSSITVSGISSGGAMATQFHVAHSKDIVGAAIFAGGPFLCAKPGLLTALGCMKTPSLINVDKLIEGTNALAQNNQIDDPANLASERVWIFHGTKDTTVYPESGRKVEEFYTKYGSEVKSVFEIPAAHGFPTENDGAPCGILSPITGFINNCNFSGSYESLNNVYGLSLTKPPGKIGSEDNIVDFDQSEFGTSALYTLDDDGYLYVPTACKDGTVQCKLHIVFHGCLSSATFVGKGYVTKTGYMDVAEANNIIILAPQVKTLLNPSHCWDWFGYTNDQYSTRDGPQIRAVYKMLRRIVAGV
jgi:poly(3-hydroxybutyrate) depolymerase